MSIDLIDQHDTTSLDDELSVSISAGEVLNSIGMYEMPKDVNQQRQRRPVSITHLTPRQLDTIAIFQPESVGVDSINSKLIRHQIVIQQFCEKFQLSSLILVILQPLVVQVTQPSVCFCKRSRFLKHRGKSGC